MEHNSGAYCTYSIVGTLCTSMPFYRESVLDPGSLLPLWNSQVGHLDGLAVSLLQVGSPEGMDDSLETILARLTDNVEAVSQID